MAAMRESCVFSEDVPPPLEDMSELLRTVEGMRGRVKPKHAVKKSTSAVADTKSVTVSQMEDKARQMQKNAWVDKGKQEKKHNSETKPAESDTFCGFQKGFLLPKAKADKSTTKETKSEDSTDIAESNIPFLKPQNKTSEDSYYRIPEVQQAMDASHAFLENKEWVTNDLLTQIQGNETLAKKLGNPGFAQALNEFQANPQAAMAKYGSNPEMQAFLMEFCKVLGDHFTKLGDTQTTVKAACSQSTDMCIRSSTGTSQITDADEVEMQRILAKPDVKEALLDTGIQQLIETLRTNPDEAQKLLATCNRELRGKVRVLVDNGLLQFQM